MSSPTPQQQPNGGSITDEAILQYEKKMTRRILWKLDIWVLPPLALLWLANFIDRSNIGNARLAGLEEDLHMEGNQFNSALAVFYAGYIISELPSNLVLKRVGANLWLPFIVAIWGLITTLLGIVQSYGGLLVVRILLGVFEGGLLPGMVLYLSTLYKRHELQLRIGIFYASASLSGAFGGLLASAIVKLKGRAGLDGWRWIFILEGIATVLIALVCAFTMPKSLVTAKFFTDEEREFAINRFNEDARTRAIIDQLGGDTGRATTDTNAIGVPGSPVSSRLSSPVDEKSASSTNGDVEELKHHDDVEKNPGKKILTQDYDPYRISEPFSWKEVRRGILDFQTFSTGLLYLSLCIGLYSFSLFLPTIVAGLGYSGTRAQLFTVPPYIPALFFTVIIAFLADWKKWRGPFILMLLPIAIAGYILALAAKTDNARYAAVFLMALGIYPSAPCILAILPNNHSGHYKRATSTAFQLMIANCAGFIATFAYTADQKPTHYRKGHIIVLSFLCFAWCCAAAQVLYCKWENNKRDRGERDQNVEIWEKRDNPLPGEVLGDRDPNFRLTL